MWKTMEMFPLGGFRSEKWRAFSCQNIEWNTDVDKVHKRRRTRRSDAIGSSAIRRVPALTSSLCFRSSFNRRFHPLLTCSWIENETCLGFLGLWMEIGTFFKLNRLFVPQQWADSLPFYRFFSSISGLNSPNKWQKKQPLIDWNLLDISNLDNFSLNWWKCRRLVAMFRRERSRTSKIRGWNGPTDSNLYQIGPTIGQSRRNGRNISKAKKPNESNQSQIAKLIQMTLKSLAICQLFQLTIGEIDNF